MSERFNVVFFDSEGSWDYALRDVDPEEAVNAAKRIVDRAEADENDIDDIDRVMITDENDFTVFLWEAGKGIVFPTPEMREEARHDPQN